MRRALLLTLTLAVGGCRGTSPSYFAESSMGFSAVLIRGRLLLPTGETQGAPIYLNLESEEETYRLKFLSGRTSLLRVEPGRYRLSPARGLFGGVKSYMRIRIAGRSYRVPFPREILRAEAVTLKPARIVPIGVLEARLIPGDRGRKPEVLIRLDDSITARREIIEDVISGMMDPKTPSDLRESSITWTRALEVALLSVQQEERARPDYKPAGP